MALPGCYEPANSGHDSTLGLVAARLIGFAFFDKLAAGRRNCRRCAWLSTGGGVIELQDQLIQHIIISQP
eukprot:scaffold232995_cov18-Prasinocladus_malaysianus.AAC.1